MPTGRPVVGGDKMFASGMRGTDVFIGIIRGLAALFITGLMIGADLCLGPFFLYAVSEEKGNSLEGVALSFPWMVSAATTGLQYALFQVVPEKRRKWVFVLAVVIAIADTLTDIGGFNALYFKDPSAGETIVPLGQDAGIGVWVANVAVGAVCLLHEPLLGTILARFQGWANKAAGASTGDTVEGVFTNLAGFLYNFAKVVGVMSGVVGMYGLDFFMMPGGDYLDWWLMYIISGGGTALLIALWRWYRHVGKAGFKSLKPFYRYLLLGAMSLTLADTFVDILGFNNAMFGEQAFIISEPTPAWLLIFIMLVLMCSASEAFSSEIIDPVTKKYKKRRGGSPRSRGGYSDYAEPEGIHPSRPEPQGPADASDYV